MQQRTKEENGRLCSVASTVQCNSHRDNQRIRSRISVGKRRCVARIADSHRSSAVCSCRFSPFPFLSSPLSPLPSPSPPFFIMSSGRAMGRNAQYGGGGGGTGNSKLEEAQRKVDDVKGVMHQNIR